MRRRYKHNLDHYNIVSSDMGQLIPITVAEVTPGESWQHHINIFMRALPQVAPVMHPTHVSLRSFFIPNRILWDTRS